MAERRHWHDVCLTMTMRQRLARLFTIKTRTEALLVTYAIAVGAIERGLHYMDQYPGYAGVVLAIACLGVPFVAGAKLVDSVKPIPVAVPARATPDRRRADAPNRRDPRPWPIDRRVAVPADRRRG